MLLNILCCVCLGIGFGTGINSMYHSDILDIITSFCATYWTSSIVFENFILTKQLSKEKK